jgi:hypothetical protein
MSRIYFHSESKDSEVRGSERAYAAHLVNDMFQTALGVSDWDSPEHPHVLRQIIIPTHYCLRDEGQRFERSFSTALSVAGVCGPVLRVDGENVDIFSAALNTAMVMGSDAIKLSVRLHGQCEVHAYVEGPNREWLANMIERGREIGIFREESGWESVVTHLRERDDEPVVTSYSVCGQFPNPGAAGWKPTKVDESGEADWDEWYDFSEAEQWAKGMEALRASPLMEMKPDNWDSYYFGDGVTGFDLLAKAVELGKTMEAAA